MICKNCKYNGEAKEGGSFNLCPKCLFNSLVDDTSNSEDKEFKSNGVFTASYRGDGSVGIEGSISIKDKDSAIMLITGIMDQFNISANELVY